MRILVIGSTGFAGERICSLLSARHDVVGSSSREGCAQNRLRLEDANEIDGVVGRVAPDAVVIAAGATNVDECEQNPARAHIVNGEGPAIVARAAHEIGAHTILLSTDYVFDGEEGSYRPDSQPRPINAYGRSKLAGELGVLEANPTNAILRVSGLFGLNITNNRWLEHISRPVVQADRNRFSSPTWLDDLVGAVEAAAVHRIAGIHHASGPTRMSRYDFAQAASAVLNIGNRVEHADESGRFARRPRDTSLSPSPTRPWSIRSPALALQSMRSLDLKPRLHSDGGR